ncbi:MAG: flavodoxin, partial [Bacteroidales bacterium]|nr:flavodoxin [Bacteroidales bacterium]
FVAPTIINTFLESYDLSGKTIVPFATSLGSSIGKTNQELLPSCEGAKLLTGKVLKSDESVEELKTWANEVEK